MLDITILKVHDAKRARLDLVEDAGVPICG